MNGNEQPISAGTQYAFELLHMWIEICEIAQDFRQNLLTKQVDADCTYAYISKLTRLWVELLPKIKGRSEFKTFETEFLEFEIYYFDPTKLTGEEHAEDLFKLERILRTALEKLKITSFEG